jgi:hypothetical protein
MPIKFDPDRQKYESQVVDNLIEFWKRAQEDESKQDKDMMLAWMHEAEDAILAMRPETPKAALVKLMVMDDHASDGGAGSVFDGGRIEFAAEWARLVEILRGTDAVSPLEEVYGPVMIDAA